MEKRIKKAYICRDINEYFLDKNLSANRQPEVGDVAIFEVLTIGKHSHMQAADKRNTAIYPGDYMMAAFGTRYATEQFEGYVPEQPMSEYHILGAGGTVGIIHSMHSKFRHVGPTRLRMVGYAVDSRGNVLNTKQLKEPLRISFSGAMPAMSRVILSIGSSMDSGKTTTAAHMVRGLKRLGKSVGFIKLTGTVYTKDCDLNYDNGADVAMDFSALGFPSTYMCSLQELLDLHETLLSMIGASGLDYVVMEIADGIFQRETDMLLSSSKFMEGIDRVVFSAGDSLAAVQGVQALRAMHIEPVALCGLFTASPLLIQEVKRKLTLPVFNLEDLVNGSIYPLLAQGVEKIA